MAMTAAGATNQCHGVLARSVSLIGLVRQCIRDCSYRIADFL